jgi:hypothetical protein
MDLHVICAAISPYPAVYKFFFFFFFFELIYKSPLSPID